MRTEIDLNESEIDLNECEHFLKANLDRTEIELSWIDLVRMTRYNMFLIRKIKSINHLQSINNHNNQSVSSLKLSCVGWPLCGFGYRRLTNN